MARPTDDHRAARDRVPEAVTGGRDSVGLRVPAHPMTLELIRLTGTGLAAPSANRFGDVSPTTAAHVVDDLADFLDPTLDVILDGGACPVGVESTIVDFCADPPQLLRAGGITPEEIAELLSTGVSAASGPARASGMLDSHYAPRGRVVLVETRMRRRLAERRVIPGRSSSICPTTSPRRRVRCMPSCVEPTTSAHR